MTAYTYVPVIPDVDFGMIYYNGVPMGQYGTAADVDKLNQGLYGFDVVAGGRLSHPPPILPPVTIGATTTPALPPTETTNTVYVTWDDATMNLQTVADSFYFEPKSFINATLISPSAFPYDVSNVTDKASYANAPLAYMAQHAGFRWTQQY